MHLRTQSPNATICTARKRPETSERAMHPVPSARDLHGSRERSELCRCLRVSSGKARRRRRRRRASMARALTAGRAAMGLQRRARRRIRATSWRRCGAGRAGVADGGLDSRRSGRRDGCSRGQEVDGGSGQHDPGGGRRGGGRLRVGQQGLHKYQRAWTALLGAGGLRQTGAAAGRARIDVSTHSGYCCGSGANDSAAPSTKHKPNKRTHAHGPRRTNAEGGRAGDRRPGGGCSGRAYRAGLGKLCQLRVSQLERAAGVQLRGQCSSQLPLSPTTAQAACNMQHATGERATSCFSIRRTVSAAEQGECTHPVGAFARARACAGHCETRCEGSGMGAWEAAGMLE